MKLTDRERDSILATLREEAIAADRRIGCTCQPEPHLTLTETVHGPHHLPMWVSDHDPPCPLAAGDGTVLLYTGSGR